MAKGYSNEEITVFFDNETCIHSANCVNGLKSVFNPKARPWINMQGASSDEIIKVVENCPSGALSYKRSKEMTEQKSDLAEDISVQVNKGGPYLIKGNVKIIDKDGTETVKKGTVALCRCGVSQNKPYCDGSHKSKGFDV